MQRAFALKLPILPIPHESVSSFSHGATHYIPRQDCTSNSVRIVMDQLKREGSTAKVAAYSDRERAWITVSPPTSTSPEDPSIVCMICASPFQDPVMVLQGGSVCIGGNSLCRSCVTANLAANMGRFHDPVTRRYVSEQELTIVSNLALRQQIEASATAPPSSTLLDLSMSTKVDAIGTKEQAVSIMVAAKIPKRAIAPLLLLSPKTIVVIADKSGSMGGHKITILKHVLKTMYSRFGGTHVQIKAVAFSSEASVIEFNEAAINSLRASGGTNYMAAVTTTLRAFPKADAYIFITDGANGNIYENPLV